MTEVPATAQEPVCYRHPSRVTYVRCTRCDRPICPDCMNVASVGHQCPECVSEGRRTQRPVRTAFGGSTVGVHGYVTIGLIVINCLVQVLSFLSAKNGDALAGGNLSGLLGSSTPLTTHFSVWGEALYTNGATSTIGVSDGEYYRLFTAMFVHYGLLHLAMNMYALYILGRPLEAHLGPARFLAVYLICGLGGNVACYVFQPANQSAGASTALFGLFGVFFFVLRKLGRSASGLVPVLVINLVFTFYVPNISIAGHIGGLVTGFLIGWAMTAAPKERRTAVQVGAIVVMLILFGVATAIQTQHIASVVTI